MASKSVKLYALKGWKFNKKDVNINNEKECNYENLIMQCINAKYTYGNTDCRDSLNYRKLITVNEIYTNQILSSVDT